MLDLSHALSTSCAFNLVLSHRHQASETVIFVEEETIIMCVNSNPDFIFL